MGPGGDLCFNFCGVGDHRVYRGRRVQVDHARTAPSSGHAHAVHNGIRAINDAIFTVVTSIEMLRKPEVQARVIRQQKTTQSLRILKLVHLMKFKSREKRCRKDIEGGRAQPRKAMSPHRRTELEEVFRLFDRDGSGSITANELVHLFAALGHPKSQEDAMDLVVELDVDKSGCLSFDEFQAYLEEEMMESEMSVEEQVDAMFSVFDVARSGHITTDEFRAIVGRLGAQLSPEDVDGIIEEVDEDDSGTIDIHEFEELVKKHLK